jgi:hypothetical protein
MTLRSAAAHNAKLCVAVADESNRPGAAHSGGYALAGIEWSAGHGANAPQLALGQAVSGVGSAGPDLSYEMQSFLIR